MFRWLPLFLVVPSLLMASKESVRKGLEEFLREYNSGSSVETPKIYKGQMAGYATGGSITTRNRVFNRKPLTITPPNYSAGCAGIDAHMGSFSFISKEEMVDAMKDILSNASTYSFLLALKSVSPQAEDTVRWLQEQANQINALNINSCEVAEQAVSAYWPQSAGASQHICRTMSSQQGIFRDAALAKHKCAQKKVNSDELDETGDALVYSYNLAWDVIQKDPFLTTQPQFAELFMSITGTIIIDEDGVPSHFPSMVTDATFMKSLFEGGEVECYLCSSLGHVSDSFMENLFKNSKGCLDVVLGQKNFSGQTSFHAEVKNKLENIQASLTENKELEESDKQILLKTSLPVGRIICALTAYHRGRSPSELANLSEVITIDIICQYLKDVVRNARSTAIQLRDVQFDGRPIDNFIANLHDVEKIIVEYEGKSRKSFEEQFQYMQMLEIIENNLRKNITL